MRKLALAIVALSSTLAAAQAPLPSAPPTSSATATTVPSFEVASIRMVDAHTTEQVQQGIDNFSMSTYPTARFFVHNTTLDFLIGQAYGIELDYIQKDHDWMDSQLYDVDATVEDGKTLTFEEIHLPLEPIMVIDHVEESPTDN